MARTKKQNQKTTKSSSTKGKPKPIPNLLTLAEKISVINEYEKIGNVRKLATMYRCSRAQIRNIWRRKDEFLKEWANKSVKERKKLEPDQTVVLAEAVREWVRRCRSQGLRVYDSRIIHTAMAIAKLMKIQNCREKRIKELIKVDKLKSLPVEISKEPKKSLKLADILYEVKDTLSTISDNVLTFKTSDSTRKPKYNRTVIEESNSDSSQDAIEIFSKTNTVLEESDSENSEDSNEKETNEDIQKSNSTASDAVLVEMEVEDDQEGETTEFHLSTIIKEEEKIMDDSIDIIEMKNDDLEIVPVKEEQVDMILVKNEQLSEDEDITSYNEALYCLEFLGDFALLKEDFRATEIINQLENWFSEQITLNS